jgi:hypothetical protein
MDALRLRLRCGSASGSAALTVCAVSAATIEQHINATLEVDELDAKAVERSLDVLARHVRT